MNQRRKKTLRALAPFLIAGVLLLAPLVLRGVLIAPHAVFIDHGTRTTQVTLANPSNDPEEIEIDVQFGYPTTDSVGNPYVVLIELPGPDQPSAAGWIRAFPRRIRLNPGQRQVVRLLATPLAHGVSSVRLLDLDDLGAEVCQQLTAEGPREQDPHLDHSQVGERAAGRVRSIAHVGPPNEGLYTKSYQ